MAVTVLSAKEASDALRWDALAEGAPAPDAYHRAGYALAYERAGHGRAVALHVETAAGAFLVPLLLRPLSELSLCAGSTGLDGITPYGYGGLLPLWTATPCPSSVSALVEELRAWSAPAGVVSIALRLHPVLDDARWLAAAAPESPGLAVRAMGPTAGIALASFAESGMRHDRRANLKVAREASLHVTWSSRSDRHGPTVVEALRIFRTIYDATMKRLAASQFYFFQAAYYETLAEGLGDGLAIGIAWRGDEPVGATLFLAGKDLAHYHLSGTTDLGRELNAQTLLLREAVPWARGRGCRLLHLGGGVSPGDSLFKFKASFGGPVYQYAMASLVTDPLRYQELVARRRALDTPVREGYFPEYRA